MKYRVTNLIFILLASACSTAPPTKTEQPKPVNTFGLYLTADGTKGFVYKTDSQLSYPQLQVDLFALNYCEHGWTIIDEIKIGDITTYQGVCKPTHTPATLHF